MPHPVRIVFVCSGNICRSPTAEAVLTALAERSGRTDLVSVTSSGTGAWHAGDDMDRRSRATLEAAGYTPGRHVARQFHSDDFAANDVVVALDSGHRAELADLADEADDPAPARAKILLLREYDPDAGPADRDVADPYYGGPDGFAEVLAQIERSCAALLDAVRENRATHQQLPRPPL